MPHTSHWPTEDESRRLAAELLAELATAPSEIAAAFQVPLTRFLDRRFRYADRQMCEVAVNDALFAVFKSPSRYDPARLEFGAFLRLVAKRKMLNLVAKHLRRPKILSLEFVEEPVAHGNSSLDDSLSWDDPRLTAEESALDPTEAAVLELMRRGVREKAAFAKIPGFAPVPPNELAAEVKRCKDRIKKRLSRAVGGAK
ncbi:MAG: hypothetical protein K8U57_26240 [Planctomycetes bacterium]|nr:hypothetical protein [Planctomycetota bacterium]